MKARGFVGTTAEGDRVWVKMELRQKDANGRFNSATDHRPVGEYVEFTMSAVGLLKGRRTPARDIDFGGQSVDTFRAITKPAAGWSAEDVRDLADLWDAWHLNGMQAGCVHVEPVIEADRYGRMVPSLDLTPPCPETGYRYGHAWLVKTLPVEIVEKINAYAARLDGTWPLR